MSTQQKTVDYILEQSAGAGTITARKMFGEYGMYCDGKVMAFICDDQLFIKPTEAGRAYLGEVTEASLSGLQDVFPHRRRPLGRCRWLAGLVKATRDLPAPKAR